MRLDKWLWVARLFKARALAAEAVSRGRVEVNGQPAKPGRELKLGDRLSVRQGAQERVVQVQAFAAARGPALQAQALYAETPESRAARELAAQARRLGTEPASTLPQGRPTKRNRRQLVAWQRWSAVADDEPPKR